MEKKSLNSFETFLETVRTERSASANRGVPPRRIVIYLVQHGPTGVSELQEATSLSFGEFGDAITSLRETGDISLTGPSGSEVATLTEQGRSAAEAIQRLG